MSRILDNIHADAEGLCRDGLFDEVTMRELDALCLPPVRTYTADDVRRIRRAAHVSQAVFAHVLGVGATTIQKWEQGIKKPSGASRRLLQIVEDRGIGFLSLRGTAA
ncbi:MAG: DNA-binding transcriptional regulator, partial [Verrucomicrobiota bacterium]